MMNIYRKFSNKILIIPPLILLLLSLFYLPSLKMGIDFKGGTLITLRTSESISLEEITSMLGESASASISKISEGYLIEIEIPLSKEEEQLEETKAKFDRILKETINLKIESKDTTTKEAELEELTRELEQIIGPITKNEGLNKLEESANEKYEEYYQKKREELQNKINRLPYQSLSIERVSPLLSTQFISAVLNAAFIAAIISTIVVYLFFREIGPTVAVLVGALSDILMALGAMSFFGIPLTLSSFAALMMLIGYSLDTDVLLTTRIVRSKEDPRDSAYEALKTGLTMSLTGLIAFIALLGVGVWGGITTYYEIAGVAIAGLVGDMFATWGINAVLLLWFKGRK